MDNNAYLIGFRVSQNESAKMFIRNHSKVNVGVYNTIYDLSEGVDKILSDKIKVNQVSVMGKMKILKVFRVEANRVIAGGRVLEGVIEKGEAKIYSQPNNTDGKECSIMRVKQEQDDIQQAKEGMEIGVQLNSNTKVSEGDILEYIKTT